MRIDVLTLFPEAFQGPLDVSILRRAREAGILEVKLHDIREHALDRHRSVDDYPFGGGQGMVMRADVLDRALSHVQQIGTAPGYAVYLSPQGERFTDSVARELAAYRRLVLVCGHYEGVDQRFIDHCVDRELSIGDYVLTGGELPAMVLIDAVARHIPGALGDAASSEEESFAGGLLEHPQYTRPADYRGWSVPAVLLSGHHAQIEAWKQQGRIERTRARRPDLLTPVNAVLPPAKRKTSLRGLAVRTATLADFPAIRALREVGGAGIGAGRLDDDGEMEGLLARDPDLFLVAEHRRRVVGVVVGGFDGRCGYVYYLAADPTLRGRGIGRELMGELEARFRRLGCIRLNLLVADRDFELMAFFEREGWSRMGVSAYRKDLAGDA